MKVKAKCSICGKTIDISMINETNLLRDNILPKAESEETHCPMFCDECKKTINAISKMNGGLYDKK